MVRVAITTRKIKNPNYNEIYNAISDDWLIYFRKLKIEPILITDKLTNPIEYFKKTNCKSLFLLNGEDTKIKFKKNKIIKGTSRDYIEYKLLKYCLKKKLPILGVCRGHQFINLCFGGKLKKIPNHVCKSHKVQISNDEIKKIFKSNYLNVNSYHNYCITKFNKPKKLNVWASIDDTIEGFYNKNYKILTLMWHPERRKITNLNEIKLVRKFLKL